MKKQNDSLTPKNETAAKILKIIDGYKELLDNINSTATSCGLTKKEIENLSATKSVIDKINENISDFNLANSMSASEAADNFLIGYLEERESGVQQSRTFVEGELSKIVSSYQLQK